MPSASEILKNIQPNILRPCRQCYASRLHLFRFRDKDAAQQWLRSVTPRLFKANDDSNVWLNVSFTFPGLTALGLDPLDLADFPAPFRAGMARRSKLLGDPPGALDPKQPAAHVALLVLTRVAREQPLFEQLLEVGQAAQQRKLASYPRSALAQALAAHLDAACGGELAEITDPSRAAGLEAVRPALDLHHALVLDDDRPVSVEYFGFRDGISQPRVIENDKLNAQLVIGETGRPAGSLLSDGMYMVVRQLEQNVSLFWEQMDENARAAGFDDSVELAEFLVGRRQNGQPIGHDAPEAAPTRCSYGPDNQLTEAPPPAFVYEARDESSAPVCPFQSHVRRVNPQVDPAKAATAITPRLLRRGMSYHQDGQVGLMFMAFNADLERQFEFIQSSWIQHGNHAGGLSSHCDPISSNVQPAGARMQRPACTTFVAGRGSGAPVALRLPDFVTLKWGEYFFVPSRTALERMCQPRASRQTPGAPVVDEALQLETVIGWINDTQLARPFWSRHVPDHGLRIDKHVFVKDPATVRTILSDPRASQGFSVCEYGRRLRSVSGPFVLGLDVDGADYRREAPLLRVIPRSYQENQQIRLIARGAVKQLLKEYILGLGLRTRPEPLRNRTIIAVALSSVWGKYFGLPGPSRSSLLTWAQEITDAVFRQGPDEIKKARAELTGKELRAYVQDQIVAALSGDADPELVPLRALLQQFSGFSDDDTARMLAGIMVGSLTAVAGTFVPGLARFAVHAGAGSNLAEALRAAPGYRGEDQQNHDGEPWPLYRLLASTLETDQLGGPDYLYRTYLGQETKQFQLNDQRPHVPIEPGDVVCSWIGGAARLGDPPDREIRFGAGEHMCPGREMARAIIDGILFALSECKELKMSDAGGLEFEVTLG